MEVVFKFNLPEDYDEMTHAQQGKNYYCALHDIKQEIRKVLKYGTEDTLEAILEKLRSFIPVILEEY